jgi:hypothetical protein
MSTSTEHRAAANGKPISTGTQAFKNAMEEFETTIVRSNIYGYSLEKEQDAPAGNWYCDGQINNLFKMFLHGIEYGRFLHS